MIGGIIMTMDLIFISSWTVIVFAIVVAAIVKTIAASTRSHKEAESMQQLEDAMACHGIFQLNDPVNFVDGTRSPRKEVAFRIAQRKSISDDVGEDFFTNVVDEVAREAERATEKRQDARKRPRRRRR